MAELAGFVAVVRVANCTYTTKYRMEYLVVFVKLGITQGIATVMLSKVLVELWQRANGRLAGS